MTDRRDSVCSDRIEAERQARLELLAQMREPFTDVPSEEIEREVARAIAEVRRDKRDEASRITSV